MGAKTLKITHVTKKGQVVIPKSIRQRLNLKEGTPLGVEVTDNGVIMLKEIGTPFDKSEKNSIRFWEEGGEGESRPVSSGKFPELSTDGTFWSGTPGWETVELGFELSRFYLSIHESGRK